jgi:LacI family transcriptional regulator
MDAANQSLNTEWMQHCPPTVQGGRAIARELMAAYPKLTAIFCYNDLVAVGALQACADLGRMVPDDMCVIGFDDIPLAALVTPPLTTCRTPRYEMGASAMRLLLNQIDGCSGDCTDIVLHPELIVRESAP